jgi:hypothetical protein
MGIRSTRDVSRTTAIERILKIDKLIASKKYREIESETSEHSDIGTLVNQTEAGNFEEETLDQWTNDMLGDFLDNPLYRFSMFDNYLVHDDEPS